MLKNVYSEYKWLPWKFNKKISLTEKNVRIIREFLEYSGEILGVKNLEDWYKISKQVTY